MKKLDIKKMGQVFTPLFIVDEIISLIKNKGKILEPSAGDGAFSNVINSKKLVSLEIDKYFANKNDFINIDFFNYSEKNKFDTIIGNPPYVRYQDIDKSTKSFLNNQYKEIFDNRSNLYLFFIFKSMLHLKKHGEIVFITPRDFLKATSSIKLNKFIYEQGTITDIIELGDKKIFNGSSPNTIIWRFEKNNFSRQTNIKEKFSLSNGQLLFTKNKYNYSFNDLFFVKVGAVSGADSIFTHEDYGNVDFVCSYTNKTGKTKKMIYDIKNNYLEQNKEKLITRKIKKFTEKNWWEWGRKHYNSLEYRIYVNQKTRNKKPFFIHKSNYYDGSILAVFPKFKINKKELKQICDDLNSINWGELGFIVDGRYIFSQKSLENTLLPEFFKKYF